MTFYENHCSYLIPMAGWFFFSALLSLYNKYIFGSKEMAFPCPLTMTSVHFLMQWIVSYCLTSCFPRVFGGGEVKAMSWRNYLLVSIPCGCVTSFDIGLSNEALVRITITFYTMVKASSPIFVLFFAFIFRIEQITFSLISVIAVITFGEFLTVFGEAEFNAVGFILCLSSSILAGLRWTMVQFFLNRLEPPLVSAISTLRLVSSTMFISLTLIAFIVEEPIHTLYHSPFFASRSDSVETVLIAFIGAFLAVSMVLCEFCLIMKSNAIVLMIGGIVKELFTITLGVSIFKDTLDTINIIGCLIVFSGVVLYKTTIHSNAREMKKESSYSKQYAQNEKVNICEINNDVDQKNIYGNLTENDNSTSLDIDDEGNSLCIGSSCSDDFDNKGHFT